MSRETRRLGLANAEIVHSFDRRAALAADHAEAVFAQQRPGHRLATLGTIKRRAGRRFLLLIHLSIIAVTLSGCLRLETTESAIGEAYVAPATLQLREEIAPRAALTGTLKHGTRVEILARHRRFAKVRAPGGAVGWTDGRQLLSARGMEIVREQSSRAAESPAQGSATAADAVNVHITPHRGSPSFYQLREGERISLAGRAIMPRIQYVPPGEQSGQLVTPETVRDDWSMVCLPGGARCGWVLTSMLMLDLPDELIQLAEGHRITAFFTLGHTLDHEGRERPIYLWTTSTTPPEHFQFDAFRVFSWNAARARYDSTHAERNLHGYHPVEVTAGKIRLIYGPADGSKPVERHAFELRGRKLHALETAPWQAPGGQTELAGPLDDAPEEATSLWERTRDRARSWWR